MSRRKRRPPREPVTLSIESLSHEGRGVARLDGKTVFVHNALPGETVTARVLRRRGQFDEAEALSVETPAANRADPRCPHYDACGGCAQQHLPVDEQRRHKQSVLLELLEHHGGVSPAEVLAPITGPVWGYRRKARLGVKLVPKKGGIVIGFRERNAPYITASERCEVLDPRVGQNLPALRELVQSLSISDRVPQIEISLTDKVVALIVRHLAPLSEVDCTRLRDYETRSGHVIYLQPGGLDTIAALSPPAPDLSYVVADSELHFAPQDFTQVNHEINQKMVPAALQSLELEADSRVLDLFCGIGNFTVPIGMTGARVQGVEGDAGLVARARGNAADNAVACEFVAADLFDPDQVAALAWESFDRLLLDPPRAGAEAVVRHARLAGIGRIVYVSCNAVTLARDTATLCEQHGFHLAACGILDMFPHTAHVESMAVFDRR